MQTEQFPTVGTVLLQRVHELAEMLPIISISECTHAIAKKTNKPHDRSPEKREPYITGQKIFFALCVLDVSLGSQFRPGSASFVPNPCLGDKIERQTCAPHLFCHY